MQKQTKDIYLAAALLSLGAIYEGADRSDPKHMQFKFSPRKATIGTAVAQTQDLDFIETQWVNKTLVVNAAEYAAAIKSMKSIVHSD